MFFFILLDNGENKPNCQKNEKIYKWTKISAILNLLFFLKKITKLRGHSGVAQALLSNRGKRCSIMWSTYRHPQAHKIWYNAVATYLWRTKSNVTNFCTSNIDSDDCGPTKLKVDDRVHSLSYISRWRLCRCTSTSGLAFAARCPRPPSSLPSRTDAFGSGFLTDQNQLHPFHQHC